VRNETGVHLDEPDDVRVGRLDEARDAVEHAGIAAQVAGARTGQVECRPGARGVADVVEQQAHRVSILKAVAGIRYRGACATLAPERPRGQPADGGSVSSVTQKNPIRLFVCHVWQEDEDYLRVFEYLESASNFFYRNTGTPDKRPPGDKEALRDDLRRQITDAEIVIIRPQLYRKHLDWPSSSCIAPRPSTSRSSCSSPSAATTRSRRRCSRWATRWCRGTSVSWSTPSSDRRATRRRRASTRSSSSSIEERRDSSSSGTARQHRRRRLAAGASFRPTNTPDDGLRVMRGVSVGHLAHGGGNRVETAGALRALPAP